MRVARWMFSGCLFLSAWHGRPARAQAPASPGRPDSDPAGWYQVTTSHQILVARGPGDGLRVLDFDSARFAALTENSDSSFGWDPGAVGPKRLVRFERAEDGTILRLWWQDSTGGGFYARAHHYPFAAQTVHFTSRDSTRLAGTVLLPTAPATRRRPAAVIIQGSGDSDRDNVWAFHIAQALARAGVVVLLPDKRGSGDSEGDWKAVGFEELAWDALAGAQLLAGYHEVNSRRVGMVGLSQGGWIAPLAARLDTSIAFVVNISGAAVTPYRQVAHEIRQDLITAGLPDSSVHQVLGLLDRAQQFSRTGSAEDWRRYIARRTELSRGTLARVVARAEDDSTDWSWGWWRRVGDFDPLPLWRSYHKPVLVVYGAEDEQDNVPVAESRRLLDEALLPARLANHLVRVFAGTGHTLRDAATGWVSTEILRFIGDWIVRL
jgi:dipeptidyl aminopeptidase/acylaminoacyl peptidase